MNLKKVGLPPKQGLYDPQYEKDACGVGFVAKIDGTPSHDIVIKGITVLGNLEHRGATGADPNTGDGAGILIQLPDKFFRKVAAPIGLTPLPARGEYGVGMVFLPKQEGEPKPFEDLIEQAIKDENLELLGWRTVPTDGSKIGEMARRSEPYVRQFFVGAKDFQGQDWLERRLYVLRKVIESRVEACGRDGEDHCCYIPSLSTRTIIYKGLLTVPQLSLFYSDLTDPAMESALALVHQRFSTNTFPTWDRAHPYRYIAHNGEINTLRGNSNWMNTRQSQFTSDLLGDDVTKLYPVVVPGGSDSASFDNVLELLVQTGRDLPHAMMMMVPEAWETQPNMDPAKKAFYDYHQSLIEPWDGPAAISFTNGRVIGATLDRNGLRPGRYVVTRDGLVVVASEVGVLDIPVEEVVRKGRLEPGKMFLVDLEQGRIISDQELKNDIVNHKPYGEWLAKNKLRLSDLPPIENYQPTPHDAGALLLRQQAFAYTSEELRLLLAPMAATGEEAMGSMGNDTPLAILSKRSQLLYNYFKQLFAQVTNPPIDPIREDLVMSISASVGTELNLLDETAEHCRQLHMPQPILTSYEMEQIRKVDQPGFKTCTLSLTYPIKDGPAGLKAALSRLEIAAAEAINNGYNILVLSDRGVNSEMAPVPALMATGTVHHYLIRNKLRTRCGLIVESGEPREVMHFALLIGYGASAINPYLALETLKEMHRQGFLPSELSETAIYGNYVKAIKKGLLKIFSKMGISTFQSYQGAQIFEIIGLNEEIVARCFDGTASRLGGIGFEGIAAEIQRQHENAFLPQLTITPALDRGGQYQWRQNGEQHFFNPDTIARLQHATASGNYKLFKKFTALVNNDAEQQFTLRGLLKFKKREAIPLEEVEPVEAIMKRFCTGAMSFGSISQEAHETLAIAMNRIGGKSNTGEGGEDSARFKPDANGDWRRSAIKQVASGRFGVTSHYLVNASEIQIKMAQGAKPGEGGQLPGGKVDKNIARVRNSVPGVTLISPPPHHDIYSIEDLAQLIFDLKNVNPRADISVKLVAEAGVGTIAAGVAKAHADAILISGYDGGTGASPLTSIKHAGIPWEIGLAETHQVLMLNDLRSRVRLQTDGQLKTGRDVVISTLLGAEEYGFATAPLVASGCILMRKCHLNTCPVGIATQDPVLRAKFNGKPEYIINFFTFIAQEVREYMAELGFRTINEMVGRVDVLEANQTKASAKAHNLDLSLILYKPETGPEVMSYKSLAQDHGLDKALDNRLLELCLPALEKGQAVEVDLPIRNSNRTVGARLGGEVSVRYGAEGLPADTIRLNFNGSAGQSFGAFVPNGITLTLEGDANDYVGKGLCGGQIIVKTPVGATYDPRENIIIGNTTMYGAISGEAYFNGVAGERFCVRNSGASAVVEGLGDHGCEYMTGGRVVVLGRTGRNFGAGMSGGIAYVLDEDGLFHTRCNPSMIDLEPVTGAADQKELQELILKHLQFTGSRIAEDILLDWSAYLGRFVKVTPREYRRALAQLAQEVASHNG